MKVEVKVTTVISVENVELGVADREQVVAAKVIKYVRLREWISACNNILHYCLFRLTYVVVVDVSDFVCNVGYSTPLRRPTRSRWTTTSV